MVNFCQAAKAKKTIRKKFSFHKEKYSKGFFFIYKKFQKKRKFTFSPNEIFLSGGTPFIDGITGNQGEKGSSDDGLMSFESLISFFHLKIPDNGEMVESNRKDGSKDFTGLFEVFSFSIFIITKCKINVFVYSSAEKTIWATLRGTWWSYFKKVLT